MKKQILSIVAALSILTTLTVTGFAHLDSRVTADIPFDFMVGETKLPAGKYTVEPFSPRDTLVIRSRETGAIAVFQVNNDRTENGKTQAKLIFNRYGAQTFLSQIWDGYNKVGQKLGRSRAEREAAKKSGDQIVSNTAGPESITVLAQRGQ
ncbi:MAG TPA: hypothetical protein VFD58_08965 [Blastocatellia bacterium]|nr:hypothetical protein [Blastocatellia bacterium]